MDVPMWEQSKLRRVEPQKGHDLALFSMNDSVWVGFIP